MKRMIMLTLLLLTLLGVIRGKDRGGAEIRFEQLSHNFGTLNQGDPQTTFAFEFTNTGAAPLLITRAVTSCRCISIKIPKRPVKAGESGEIVVTFDPKDVGVFNKTIEVHANISGKTITLLISGEVESR